MANWTVSSYSNTETQGDNVNAGSMAAYADLVITPLTGYVVSATDFKIGGATETPANTWTGGNVDTEIYKVVFSDIGTAGAVGNTVNVRVHFDSTALGGTPWNMPGNNDTLYIDIDEKEAIKAVDRYLCVRSFTTAEQDSNSVNKHTVTYASAPTGITTTNNTPLIHNLGTSPPTVDHSHQGSVNEGPIAPGAQVFQVTFASNTTFGYYYLSAPTFNIAAGTYSSAWQVIDSSSTFTTMLVNGVSASVLTSIVYTAYYTPPVPNPDPGYTSAGSLCELGQLIIFDHILSQEDQGEPGAKKYITDVETLDTFINSNGEIRLIEVIGSIGAVFKLVVTRTGDGHTYDFSTDTFTSGATTLPETTIGNTGTVFANVSFPSIVSNATYDITIVPTSPTSTLAGVPLIPGDLRLYQYIPVTASLDIQGDVGGADVWDDAEFPAPITLTGKAGYTYSADLVKAFSFTITEAMVTDTSIDGIAPKSSLDFTLNSEAFTSQAVDGDISSATFDVASTSGIIATTPINWSVQKLALFDQERSSSIIVGEVPDGPPQVEELPENGDNLVVGMILTSDDIPRRDTIKITALNAGSITLDGPINVSTRNPITFTADGVTVSSVTDGNTLVASQTLTGMKDDFVLTFGGGESDIQAYVSGATSSQSGDNVILAGNFHIHTFPIANTVVTIDINELITITDE